MGLVVQAKLVCLFVVKRVSLSRFLCFPLLETLFAQASILVFETLDFASC